MAELFVRNEEHDSAENSDDAWDDTELIKAYDRAICDSKQKIATRLGRGKKQTIKSSKWSVGDACRAIYDVDGLEYEATIENLQNETQVTVKFCGYENIQVVDLPSLLPSKGRSARDQQIQESSQESAMDTNDLPEYCATFNRPNMETNGFFMEPSFPPPPPLPPKFSKQINNQEQEALNAMLMSWYMSGYYTGYYQAQKETDRSKRLK